MAEKIQALVKSRRFIILVAGMAVVFAEELFGIVLNEEHLTNLLTIMSAWIVGDSLRKTE